MRAHELHDDPLLQALGALPPEDASPARDARVRARCHAALARSRRPGAAALLLATVAWRRLLEPALVAALCVTCLVEVARRAAALLGP